MITKAWSEWCNSR